jgi:hypothetical protein
MLNNMTANLQEEDDFIPTKWTYDELSARTACNLITNSNLSHLDIFAKVDRLRESDTNPTCRWEDSYARFRRKMRKNQKQVDEKRKESRVDFHSQRMKSLITRRTNSHHTILSTINEKFTTFSETNDEVPSASSFVLNEKVPGAFSFVSPILHSHNEEMPGASESCACENVVDKSVVNKKKGTRMLRELESTLNTNGYWREPLKSRRR